MSNNYDGGTITNEESRLMFRLALYQAFKKELDLMMASQETKFKINNVIWTTKSKVIYVRISVPKQYQMIIRYHTKDVSNQV